jgi:hypothetical protein
VIAESREALVAEWFARVGEKASASSTIPRPFLDRQFRLLVELCSESVGPFRREVMPLWIRACDQYGRVASLRGLAAGEVVEELQHLRELLALRLAPVVTVSLRPRQSFAILLRLNRLMDRGIAASVVGYTDALVATLFARNGVPVADEAEHELTDLDRQLTSVERELAALSARS